MHPPPMQANAPTILALDFDGVICDGMIEYFQVAWRTYCQIWSTTPQTPPADLAPSFYRLRPAIETGWEMPVLIRARMGGIPEEKILHDWPTVAMQIVVEEGLDAASIGAKLDHLRDEWIAGDLESWLALHRFYPGVVERLQQLLSSRVQPVIITTKEGRFVVQLLLQQGVQMPENSIFGKECGRPKHQIMRELLAIASGSPEVWFVEDRLKTLQSVEKQADLGGVRLYLADWGYNTAGERESAALDPRIQLLSLSQFTQDFSNWPEKG